MNWRHKSRQRFDEELKTAEWEIYDLEPLPEAEAQSEYDLVRYEIRMQIGLAHYEADLGSCGEVLNSAAYYTDKSGVIK